MTDETGGTGGTCVLRGCVPKKLLHYVAEFNEAMEDAAGSGYGAAFRLTAFYYQHKTFACSASHKCTTSSMSFGNTAKKA